jgi:uncharacterized FAD-dependent dehydrogenase
MGPCGLFVALILAQMGLNPLVLERGKKVRERTVDTFGFWRKRKLNTESNVQFGEGGAGTFSDGKLYSQIKDPKHYGRKVLTEFVKSGAPEEILYVSKPHIGTFRLVKMVEQMRAEIDVAGRRDPLRDPGRRHAGRAATAARARSSACAWPRRGNPDRHLVMAVGHSARDTFEMLYARGVYVEAKPFSIGFRVEHPQSLIDVCRFGPNAGNKILGAADYKIVHHASNGRSVYSFCMCPGGTVVAASSEEGRVVTNGMSQYSRNERNANSAIVVGITPEDYPGHPLAGIAFQRELESRAFVLGGGNYDAPGQLMGDFVKRRGLDRIRLGDPVVQAGRAPDRPRPFPARLRHRGPARSLRRLRQADQGLLQGRRGADRGRDPHLVADPHQAPRRQPAKPEHARPVPGRRRRGLRGRHHVGGGGRHPRGREAVALAMAALA